MYNLIKQADPDLYQSLENELKRQTTKLELIASENFTSPEVMEAQGSIMTNKYAEGYPGNRYYGGCEYVDVAENIARDRAKKLFKAEYANVQPHSGSSANMAVYHSFIKIGDNVLGMKLEHGGHLTHGSPVNFSGRFFNFIPYELGEDGRIDYNQVEDLAKKNKPKLITVGASAYSRDIDYKAFRDIADSVGAFLFADIAHPAGIIARGYLTNAVEYAHVTATTTHKTLRGPRGGLILLGKDFDNPFGIVAPKSGRTRKMSEVIDSWVMPGLQGGPLMHVIAAKAVAFAECLTDSYDNYIKQVLANAKALCNAMIEKGYQVVSGGTDNHLMLIDIRNKGLTGKTAQLTLDEAGITCNKNTVPNETNSALVTSGIRLGTPALTTRGFKETDFKQVAEFIDKALKNTDKPEVLKQISNDVSNFASKFPLHVK
ncbi:MAG: serine hydroxymethyltransferase [Bacteroidetes bacterium]|nr:serine hydroxymethyltransferase [Bacteroidota bacterium]